jgi:cytochrome P450
MSAIRCVPDHVPPELVWDHSLTAFNAELDDPFMAAARLHEGPDIIWATDAQFGQSGWVVTRRALIEEVYTRPEHFSSAQAAGDLHQLLGLDWPLIPLEIDPPRHHLYRLILNPFFSPRAVNALEAKVQEICDALIAPFEDRGGCEFIGEFTRLFPSHVFLELMGMPRAMLPQFLQWEEALFRGADQQARERGAKSILAYMSSFLAQQRLVPTTELLQGIVTAQVDGRALTEDELMGIVFLLYTGGLDTVNSSMGWHMRHLATHPELQDRLRANREQIPQAVDELARAYGVNLSPRTLTEDLEFHGVAMRKGDVVYLPNYLGSRDAQAYDNPHVVDIDRKARMTTFATGPHICLGIHLARRELKVALEAFLSRFRNIRIREGETYRFHTPAVLGVDYLPLEWDRA